MGGQGRDGKNGCATTCALSLSLLWSLPKEDVLERSFSLLDRNLHHNPSFPLHRPCQSPSRLIPARCASNPHAMGSYLPQGLHCPFVVKVLGFVVPLADYALFFSAVYTIVWPFHFSLCSLTVRSVPFIDSLTDLFPWILH